MNTIKFKLTGKEQIVVTRKIDELDITEDELLALWSFNNHVERLVKFVKPFYEDMRISYAIPSKKESTKNKKVPTELRLSAAINELRPFMLNDDSICFYKIRNIISKQFKDNDDFNKCLKRYRKFWDAYDINKKHDNAIKMGTRYDIDEVLITTYAELLRIFIYGKYIHNGDNPKSAAIVYRVQSGFYYPTIKAELGVCIADICNMLRIFNRDFVKPILSIHKGTIKDLNWQAINTAKET